MSSALVLTNEVVVELILSFLTFQNRVSVCTYVNRCWNTICNLAGSWNDVDLRWLPSNSSIESLKNLRKTQININTRSDTCNKVAVAQLLLGPWVSESRLYNLKSLKLNHPPYGGIPMLFKILNSQTTPNLTTLEIYWTDPTTDTCTLAIPPYMLPYLESSFTTDKIENVIPYNSYLQNQSNKSNSLALRLKRVVLDCPITDVDIQILQPHLSHVEILILSRLSSAKAYSALSTVLRMTLCTMLSSICMNKLVALCIKETLHISNFNTDHLLSSNYEEDDQVIPINDKINALSPTFNLHCQNSPSVTLSPTNPNSIQTFDNAFTFMNMTENELLHSNDKLDIGDCILNTITQRQNKSMIHLVAPDLSISKASFENFRKHCKKIQIWNLAGWRYLSVYNEKDF